jgi:hypothetical protein
LWPLSQSGQYLDVFLFSKFFRQSRLSHEI